MRDTVRSFLLLRFPRTGARLQRLMAGVLGKQRRWKSKSTEEVFAAFYEENLWGNDESVSGGGSTLECTRAMREALPPLFEELRVRTILDAPCGDLNWVRTVDWSLDRYTGGDIVPQLIERLSRQYGDAKHAFVQLDISRDPLPSADVFFCRDCLIHLTNDQVLDTLRNVARSESRFLMTNTRFRASR